MAVRRLLLFPDRTLSHPSKPVRDFGPALSHLIRDLTDTLNAGPGVGLAAPQIGVLERGSVIDVSRRRTRKGETLPPSHGFLVLINPTLVEGRGAQVPREGCLSVPDLLANVRRFEEVTVRTQTPGGGERIVRARGFEALALQHEIDHLDGKLFLDRVANLKTDIFRRKTSP